MKYFMIPYSTQEFLESPEQYFPLWLKFLNNELIDGAQNIYIDSIFTSIRLSWETENTWDCTLCSRIWLSAAPWTVAHQASLSMEFSRQEYWSGFPFPTPGDLCDLGI